MNLEANFTDNDFLICENTNYTQKILVETTKIDKPDGHYGFQDVETADAPNKTWLIIQLEETCLMDVDFSTKIPQWIADTNQKIKEILEGSSWRSYPYVDEKAGLDAGSIQIFTDVNAF
ncbi:uncharacterized protein LOC134263414 [Saccostrea cucullata]|uniref:uncharacterized protein LOC134263414 n=1 Tax=Saccostrea cuccullata TaxID=36930 RepID=UPI002ED4E78F